VFLAKELREVEGADAEMSNEQGLDMSLTFRTRCYKFRFNFAMKQVEPIAVAARSKA
jgi:hypothetical protein